MLIRSRDRLAVESLNKSNNIIGQKSSNIIHKIFQTYLEDDKETGDSGFIEESSSWVGY